MAQQKDLGWKKLGELEVQSGKVYVGDGQMAPFEPGEIVELDPGKYSVEIKDVAYDHDVRTAVLRAARVGSDYKVGDQIGESWADTGSQGICDFDVYNAAMPEDREADYYEKFSDQLYSSEASVIALDAEKGALLFFCGSGFGDGTFPVHELVNGDERVGVQVVMIEDGAEYPF